MSQANQPTFDKVALIERWRHITDQLPAQVRLIAVSKTKSAEQIRTLAEAGQVDFGENYVQEALTKIQALADVTVSHQPICWHYIGHIQRNKTKELAANFAWVHGVDRLIIAERLSNQRPTQLPPLNLCLEVNIDGEASKSGCQPDELPTLIAAISPLPNIRLRGLMIIPAKQQANDGDNAFVKTKRLFDTLRQYHAKPDDWDTLSMGMSGDATLAIAAGATMVRIGTAIFGSR